MGGVKFSNSCPCTKGINSVGNRGGLKLVEPTSYITVAGLKEVLRSKKLEPGRKLETRSQGINKSQKGDDDQFGPAAAEILRTRGWS